MKNKKLKRVLKIFTINVIAYFVIYLAKTFIIWEIENPLKWIMNLGNYSIPVRTSIVFFYPIWIAMLYMFTELHED